jgi:hypothetical protein
MNLAELWQRRKWRKRIIAAVAVVVVRIATLVASGFPIERGPVMSSWLLWTAILVWFALSMDWGESE